jgi:MoxR-like ATPase
MGYVSAEKEAEILSSQMRVHPIDGIRPVAGVDDVLAAQNAVSEVYISAELCRYIVGLTVETRTRKETKLGAGPRASIALMNVCRALALIEGSDFVAPEHIRVMAESVIAHRIALDPQSVFEGITAAGIVGDALKAVKCPV